MTISRNLSILAEGVSASGVLAVTNGGTGVTTSTGTGSTVLSASPTLTGTLTVPTVTSATATALTIQSAGTTAVTIDTAQNVGIGGTPGYLLDVLSTSTSAAYYAQRLYSAANASGVSTTYLRLEKGVGYGGAIGGYISQGVGSGLVLATANGGTFTDQMWINSSGNVGVGTSSPNASAILDAQSTTKGVRFPNMTTTQKNAVSSPAAGLVVFDTTLAKLCVYSGSAWQTITSV